MLDAFLVILSRVVPVLQAIVEHQASERTDPAHEAELRRRLIRAAFDERAEREIEGP
jgi:hypothetical protein